MPGRDRPLIQLERDPVHAEPLIVVHEHAVSVAVSFALPQPASALGLEELAAQEVLKRVLL
jgi:hypothetical protein